MPFDVRESHLALNNSPHGSDTPRDSLFEGGEMLLESGIQIAKRDKGDHTKTNLNTQTFIKAHL